MLRLSLNYFLGDYVVIIILKEYHVVIIILYEYNVVIISLY